MKLLSATLALGALALFGAPAALADTISCPLPEARREIVSPLPPGWWTTPLVNRLTDTRVQDIGGRPALLCIYGESGSVQRNAPPGQTCVATRGGFECGRPGGVVVVPPPGGGGVVVTPVDPPRRPGGVVVVPPGGVIVEPLRPGVIVTPPIHAQGNVRLRSSFTLDLDNGAVPGGPGADLWFEGVRPGEYYLTTRGGATAWLGDGRPEGRGYAGCSDRRIRYGAVRIPARDLPASTFLCVRTSEGHVSQVRIDGMTRSLPPQLIVGFTTWR